MLDYSKPNSKHDKVCLDSVRRSKRSYTYAYRCV